MAPLEMLVEPVDIVNCSDTEPRPVRQQRVYYAEAKLEAEENHRLTDKVSLIVPEDKSQGLWLHLEDPETGLLEDYNFQVVSASWIEA